MKPLMAAVAVMLCGLCANTPLHAQNPDPTDIRGCTAIESDAQRLACYDHVTGRVNLPAAQKRIDTQAQTPNIFSRDNRRASTNTPGNNEVAKPMSLLDSRWELSPESKLGTFNIRGYNPVYVMPAFLTSNQNNQPHSPNPDNTVGGRGEQLDNVETKFQLSLKAKVWQGVFGDTGDLWVGYTQSSRWQVFNSALSRPFRETNYEPEAMLVFDTHYRVLGWTGRLLSVGINHQSNGRGNPLSRGWNRVIANVGFERDGWTVPRRNDDNPDISNYMGRGEVQIVHEWRGQEFGMMLRHSLRGGSRNHGAARFSWSFPMAGNLRGYMEVFKGYGESLIDYNHNATYLGVGVSLLDWY
jgi:phospholipase A1